MERKFVVAIVVLGFLAFTMSSATAAEMVYSYPTMQPVGPPSPAHVMEVSNLLIIADVSRSMRDLDKIGTERALLKSFNEGIPSALKSSALRTFGQSSYDDTVLVLPLQAFDRKLMGDTIGELKAGWGSTPLASALIQAKDDLKNAVGTVAVIVISDGENLSRDPSGPALDLRESCGDRVCIYTVHVGDSPTGREALRKVAREGGCGIPVTAAELESEKGMKEFITDVFYRHQFVDADGDGVPDWADQCPNTPKGVVADSIGCWVLQGLQFEFDKADIKPEYFPLLDDAVRALEANPALKIEIHGHTDDLGTTEYNKALSQKRAEAVKAYFVSKGLNADRFTTRGMGEMDPVASNETPEGRALNRRVELNVIGS